MGQLQVKTLGWEDQPVKIEWTIAWGELCLLWEFIPKPCKTEYRLWSQLCLELVAQAKTSGQVKHCILDQMKSSWCWHWQARDKLIVVMRSGNYTRRLEDFGVWQYKMGWILANRFCDTFHIWKIGFARDWRLFPKTLDCVALVYKWAIAINEKLMKTSTDLCPVGPTRKRFSVLGNLTCEVVTHPVMNFWQARRGSLADMCVISIEMKFIMILPSGSMCKHNRSGSSIDPWRPRYCIQQAVACRQDPTLLPVHLSNLSLAREPNKHPLGRWHR